jgi:hypothetical protein
MFKEVLARYIKKQSGEMKSEKQFNHLFYVVVFTTVLSDSNDHTKRLAHPVISTLSIQYLFLTYLGGGRGKGSSRSNKKGRNNSSELHG